MNLDEAVQKITNLEQNLDILIDVLLNNSASFKDFQNITRHRLYQNGGSR